MGFSSITFLFLFLPLALLLYFLSPRGAKNLVLLALSLAFYLWGEPILILYLIGSILLNYGAALGISSGQNRNLPRLSKAFLSGGITLQLGGLVYYKYMGFILENLPPIPVDFLKTPQEIIMPIGISFFTFQGISYLVDVYRRETSASGNIINVALYIALFPQLVAGPIVRYKDIASQIHARLHTLSSFSKGMERFVFGLGKKVIIANELGRIVDTIFELAPDHTTLGLAWLGIASYTLQIYFDFSGYTDMAIGLGLMFGLTFPENFNFPYISRSLTEFWRRWHMSLSSWFRDYVYIQLGGNRGGYAQTLLNISCVFLLTGVWHGASWNFILWGVAHGFFVICEKVSPLKGQRIPAPFKHLYCLTVITFTWVLFRAKTSEAAWHYMKCLLGLQEIQGTPYGIGFYIDGYFLTVATIAVLLSTPILKAPLIRQCAQNSFLRGTLVILVLIYSAALLGSDTHNPFIYFRF